MLTEESVDDANSDLPVMFKSRNETVQLRILVTALDDGSSVSVTGVTCIANPNPPKKYEMTNRGKGGAGAWMIHETSWETCPSTDGHKNNHPECGFLPSTTSCPKLAFVWAR